MEANLLSPAQEEEFFRRGFVVVKDIFTTSEVNKIKAAMNRLYKKGQELTKTTVSQGSQFVFSGGRLHRVVWAGANEPYLLEVSEDPRITQKVSQLLESDSMEQIINQCHFKVPGDDVEFRFHQDSENRGYGTPSWDDVNGRGSYVQTVLAVDPMKEDNGPLIFYPESSQHGHIGLDRGEVLEDYVDVTKKVSLTMGPGSLALFGPYTIHGSVPNNSNISRFVLINGYAYPGANHKKYPGDSCRTLQIRS